MVLTDAPGQKADRYLTDGIEEESVEIKDPRVTLGTNA